MQLETCHYSFDFTDLELDPIQAAALMGYKDEVPEMILEMIQKEIDFLQHAQGIEGAYVLQPAKVDRENERLRIDDLDFEVGKTISIMLRRSTRVAVFACTAGEFISKRAKDLMAKGEVLEGYITDVLGSMTVEKAMDIIHQQHLAPRCKAEGLKVSNRYSPGYCEWNIEEQHKLFTLFEPNFCHISLTQSALMMPIKSVSGVIGVGEDVNFHKYTCDTCTQTICIYRNKKQTTAVSS